MPKWQLSFWQLPFWQHLLTTAKMAVANLAVQSSRYIVKSRYYDISLMRHCEFCAKLILPIAAIASRYRCRYLLCSRTRVRHTAKLHEKGIKMKIYDDGDIRAYISTDLYSHPLRYCATLLGGEMSNLDAYGKTPGESIKKLKNARNFLRVWKKKLQERKPAMTKRQSTTAKITLSHVKNIESDISNGNGVLVRYRRKTLGVIGVERIGRNVFFRVRETSTLIPRIGCTIPKATVDAWNKGTVVTLNVGRKVGKYGLLDDQFVRSRIAYGGVYNASKSFREDIGKWEGADEPTIIATGKTTISRAEILSSVEEHADELGQEAIAVEIDGVGILVWRERGKRNYTFDPAYFIR